MVLEWVELTLWTLGLLEIHVLDGVFRPEKNPPLSLGELPNELNQRMWHLRRDASVTILGSVCGCEVPTNFHYLAKTII